MSTIAGKGCPRLIPEEEKKPLKEIERSIVKKYRKQIIINLLVALMMFIALTFIDIALGLKERGGVDDPSWAECWCNE